MQPMVLARVQGEQQSDLVTSHTLGVRLNPLVVEQESKSKTSSRGLSYDTFRSSVQAC